VARPLEDENSRVSDLCNPEHPNLDQVWFQTEKGDGCKNGGSKDSRNKGDNSCRDGNKRCLMVPKYKLQAVFSKNMIPQKVFA
jgi:hypothetical protein